MGQAGSARIATTWLRPRCQAAQLLGDGDGILQVLNAGQHRQFPAPALLAGHRPLDLVEHLLPVQQGGEAVGGGPALQLLLGHHLGIDDPAGAPVAVGLAGTIEKRGPVALDPVLAAVPAAHLLPAEARAGRIGGAPAGQGLDLHAELRLDLAQGTAGPGAGIPAQHLPQGRRGPAHAAIGPFAAVAPGDTQLAADLHGADVHVARSTLLPMPVEEVVEHQGPTAGIRPSSPGSRPTATAVTPVQPISQEMESSEGKKPQ